MKSPFHADRASVGARPGIADGNIARLAMVRNRAVGCRVRAFDIRPERCRPFCFAKICRSQPRDHCRIHGAEKFSRDRFRLCLRNSVVMARSSAGDREERKQNKRPRRAGDSNTGIPIHAYPPAMVVSVCLGIRAPHRDAAHIGAAVLVSVRPAPCPPRCVQWLTVLC